MIKYLLIRIDFQREKISQTSERCKTTCSFLLIDYGQASLVKYVCLQHPLFPRGEESKKGTAMYYSVVNNGTKATEQRKIRW